MRSTAVRLAALALLVALLPVAPAAAQPAPAAPAARPDPCENYRRPRGATEDKSAMSLAEHAARVAAGDTSALMGGRGPAADYAVDPGALEALTPQGKFALCWFAELDGNLRQLNRTLATYEHAYRCQNREDRLAQIDTDKRMVRAMLEHLPNFSTRDLRSRGSGGWILFFQWEVRDYTNTKEFKSFQRWLPTIQQHVTDYQNELRPFMAQLASQGACAGPASTFEYRVFLAGNDVLVGQSNVLKEIPTCRLKGWGTDCKPLGAVLQAKGEDLYPVSGQYRTMDEARDFYCRELQRKWATRKAVPFTAGRDWTAELSFSDKPVGISNAPSCSPPK